MQGPGHLWLSANQRFEMRVAKRAEQMILVDVTHPCPQNLQGLQGIFKPTLRYEIQ